MRVGPFPDNTLMKLSIGFSILILAFTFSAAGQTAINRDPQRAKIVTSDIELFWKAYDRADPSNDLIVFRDEYLKKGSAGLRDFQKLRIGSSCALLDTINSAPNYYRQLRKPSLTVSTFEPRMRQSFVKLAEIYPDSVFPDVYFLIGRMNSGGTTAEAGLLIGVDMYGKNSPDSLDELDAWHKAVVSSIDRLPIIVAHELIHYQQKYTSDGSATLLARSLKEGSADFIGELISGSNINEHLHKYGDPIEKELWDEFKKEMDGNDTSNWLYQGDKAKDRPADLGYYIGYKICKAYYERASDKRQAVRDILEIKNYGQFLKTSNYESKFTIGS